MADLLLLVVVFIVALAVNVAGAVLIAYVLSVATPWTAEQLWLPVLAVLLLLGAARRR
jgi:hypothetical protein